MNIFPLIISFLVIAVAELGDKSQLLTLSFATKYPFWAIVSAVSLATSILMALAVVFGSALYYVIPALYIQTAAGIAFIAFGLWAIFGTEEDLSDDKSLGKTPFVIIFSAFFMSEFGDKTQLAALALSADYGSPLLVWLGATLGMVSVNVLAAVVGRYLKNIISETRMKWVSGLAFIIFGIATLCSLTRM